MADVYKINQVIAEYFKQNPGVEKIPAKDLMPEFVKAGVFREDRKNGLPIREVLRELDDKNELFRIPSLFAERKEKNTKWYFNKKSATSSVAHPHIEPKQTYVSANTQPKAFRNRDEDYVIDLCDEVLGRKGLRQHTFDFLRGDAKEGSLGKLLPVDAYYPELELVIEYREVQHTQAVSFFDKPDKMTVSGVHRGEQRRIYDKRREEVLPKHGIELICIPYTTFNCDSQNRVLRSKLKDIELVRQLLKKYVLK